ncbi:MAG TPA: hypothetical protein VMS96_09505 [Terriglobales bacterium]|nr:hypothetical protein [Terriglobales bacterium]
MLRTIAYALGGLVLGFFLFVNLVNAPRRRETDRTNRQNAERVLPALEAYRRDHGRFPESLDALQPAYLKPVPACIGYPGDTSGKPFHYEVAEDGKSFSLGYPKAPYGMFPSDLEATFESGSRQWKTEER